MGDVAPRFLCERSPQEPEEPLLAAALRHSPQAVTIVDATLSAKPVIYCNDAFCALTGYGEGEVVGRGLDLFLADDEGAAAALNEHLDRAQGEQDVRMRRHDGGLFWNEISAGPIHNADGELRHIVLSHRDVTTHREADIALKTALSQAERANWAKTRLIAVAGHDLRQPLHTISAAIELLAREPRLSPRGQRVLGHAELAATDLDEELKALAQVAEVKRDFAPAIQAVPLSAVLEPVMRAWRPRAEYKGLELRALDTTLWVRSDPTMLRTIIRNLVANAVKYTARGRVLVGARRVAGEVSLEVWDTGPGVSPHMVSKIFDAFERADAPGEGLGLGLWIVKRTAEILGHEVTVRTARQLGSCFSLRLPRAEPS